MPAVDHKYGYWFNCVGCGQPVGLFPDGCKELQLEKGTVCHWKPKEYAGVSNSVPCELYRNTDGETFALLHAGEPEISPPISMEPYDQ